MLSLRSIKQFLSMWKMFPGILAKRIAEFGQQELEALTTGSSHGEWDYCFVWCIVYKYFLSGVKWPKIAEALRKSVGATTFNSYTGYVWSVFKLTLAMSKHLGVKYAVIELNRLKSLKALQSYIKNTLPRIYGKQKIDYFVVVKYGHGEAHFCYISKLGRLVDPWPESISRDEITQWRIYRWYKK